MMNVYGTEKDAGRRKKATAAREARAKRLINVNDTARKRRRAEERATASREARAKDC